VVCSEEQRCAMNAVDDTSVALGGDRVGSEEHHTLLGVVLDTHPAAWAGLEEQISLKQTVEALLVFINAHLSLSNSNKVVVIASHTSGARFLYPMPNKKESTVRIAHGPQMYRQFREVNEGILSELDRLLSETTHVKRLRTAVSGALSLALTYINKVCGQDARMSARILLISVSGDLSSQYIPTMNCIFAAQKKRIPIDVCKLSGDTVFLQQACDSTNGTYIKLDHPRGLIQYLMSAFMVEPSLRPHVHLGTQRDVDFRAACFVTKGVVDIGFVCSVCLCIMSQIPASGECPMCGTEYDPKALANLNKKPMVVVKKKAKKRKKLDSGQASAGPSEVGTPI
jgi:transcription initiation factor TFIIH subunit 3